ncbi:hypothetical protein AB6C64_13745 [Vibrio cyclitrophicus]
MINISDKIYSNAILIVLFNKSPEESTTFLNVVKNIKYLNNTLLVLWNNGPDEISNVDFQYDIDIVSISTLENRKLSSIYNQFLSNIISERYWILDDDSNVNLDYISEAISSDISVVSVPRVKSRDTIVSPYSRTINGGVFICGIGSGIVIGRQALTIIKSYFETVFDERYGFYGVDTTFFYRIHKCNISLKSIHGFQHDLSRHKCESAELRSFRVKERSYDLGLTLRYYPEIIQSKHRLMLSILKATIKKVLGLPYSWELYIVLVAYMNGKYHK